MPNWMSDEELGLSNGDLHQCDDCGKVYSVDEWHICPEKIARCDKEGKEAAEDYRKNIVEAPLVTKQFLVTVVAPEASLNDALDTAWAMRDIEEEGVDDILNYAWTIKEVK